MALIDHIERLQGSSPKTRHLVLLILVTLTMALVIGLWILQFRYNNLEVKGTAHATEPLRVLYNAAKDSFKEGIENFYE